ncbi:MAG: hypothetical protein ACLQPD_23925 [Desulfomonilaceae bacterium]
MTDDPKSQFLGNDQRFLRFYIKEAKVGKTQAAQEVGLTVEEVCWIWEEEVAQELQDLTALKERLSLILNEHDPTPESRPRFNGPKKVASIRVNKALYEAALEKARKEKSLTHRSFSSLLDLLLWDYLDRDMKFIEASDVQDQL